MSLKRRGMHLDIDPDRALAMILLELVIGLGCRVARWLRRHPRLSVAILSVLASWAGGPVLAQHLRALGGLLSFLIGSRP